MLRIGAELLQDWQTKAKGFSSSGFRLSDDVGAG
jgi:hypothetical protein